MDAEPGEVATATVTIAARAFAHWTPGVGWETERGTFTLQAGASSEDLPLTAEVTVG